MLADGVALEVWREEAIELRAECVELRRLVLERRDELHDRSERRLHPFPIVLRAQRREEHHVAIEGEVGDRFAETLADDVRIAPLRRRRDAGRRGGGLGG